VLKKVNIPYVDKKTGKNANSTKQVRVGELKEGESFGELSATLKEPMTCSIVTETECRIAIISQENISSKHFI
jgi:CRP-like cAMP-binding protein